MQDPILHSGWQSCLVGIPLVGMLMISFFRLDEVFTSKKKPVGRRQRPASGFDAEGEPILSDPDGRPSNRLRNRR